MTTDRTEEGGARGADDARSGAPAPVAVYSLPMRLGRYTLTKRLGVGGMAEVFLAQQDGPAGFQKTCVVKKILPHLALEPRFVTMFQREARVAAMLHHTNVVQTFELGEADGVYFIAMEYVDGPPLHQLARAAWHAGRPLPMELVACAIADCALGLSAAHALTDKDGKPLGLIHRDISPDNLIINSEGVVKILDFGVAKIEQGERTATGELKGKLPFLSPEQIRGDAVDERADIYALGVTAYWLLTGTRPFTATSDLALMQTILSEPPTPPRALNPAVPEELDALVLRMLAKDRASRPASASIIADALAEVTSARRLVVAPFVRELAALVASPQHDSAPRDAAFRAAEPKSASFRVACQQIVAHLGSDLVAAPTVKVPRPALSDVRSETEPTNVGFVDPARTTPEATLVVPVPTEPEPTRARSGVAFGVAGAAVLAIAATVTFVVTRPGTPPPAVPVPAPQPPSVAVVADAGAASQAGASGSVDAGQAQPIAVSTADAGPSASDVASVAPSATEEPAHAHDTPHTARRKSEGPRELAVRGPKNVQWLDARGRALGAGDARLKLGAADKKIVAYDRTRGVRTTIAVGHDAIDYDALPRGKLQLRANPYAEVFLGKESLGTTPFPAVDVVAGSYVVKFRYNGREETRTVQVDAGGTVRAAVDFGG